MNNIITVTLYTLREAFARKVFIFFFAVVMLVLVGFGVFASLVKLDDLMKGAMVIDPQEALRQIVSRIEWLIISPIYGLGLLLSIFSCSSFIPHVRKMEYRFTII